MKTLNIAEARQNLSAIVDEIRFGGEPIVLARYGHPVAMLVHFPQSVGAAPENATVPPRDWRDELGLRNPSFTVDPSFDDPMDDLWEVFDDNAEEPTP